MPLYMDIHSKVEGLTAQAVAEAHKRDLEVQAKHGVNYQKYWYDEGTGKVFCLVDAPSKDAAAAVHRALLLVVQPAMVNTASRQPFSEH